MSKISYTFVKENKNNMKNLEKELFDLVDWVGQGLYMSLHIIAISEFGYGNKYRVYHSDGYCFNIEKEEVDLAEDESNPSAIDGYEYTYLDDLFDGFKILDIKEAIKLIRKYKK